MFVTTFKIEEKRKKERKQPSKPSLKRLVKFWYLHEIQ
jgi:hypothetical protein